MERWGERKAHHYLASSLALNLFLSLDLGWDHNGISSESPSGSDISQHERPKEVRNRVISARLQPSFCGKYPVAGL